MFSFKNIKPHQLAALIAICISLPIAIGFTYALHSWQKGTVVFLILIICIYYFITFLVNQFVYRKIKLIYKLIYQTKASKREETYYKYILPKKTIDEVKEEVEKWASQYAEELETNQKNETFRREFLQNLSHELKTPVFAIQGYVELLLDEEDEINPSQKKFLQNTARNVERMVLLLKDLDEISKLETGEQVLYKENFIIQDLIKDVYEALSVKINQNNIKAGIKRGCEQPITIVADKEKIRQVLSNLIENATKYGKDNGSIMAGIYKTDVGTVVVEITDDGIGIANEHLPRIFERFYRTDKGRSRNVGGTGLGLAICKHIIEAHGQAMHVRSTLGVGTTIGFTIESKK